MKTIPDLCRRRAELTPDRIAFEEIATGHRFTFAEVDAHLPFEPKRFFVVYDVPGKEVRGQHAHKELHEFLVCLKGSCRVVVDNGTVRDEVVLDSPEIGLHLPAMVWSIQYMYSEDALMLVLASDVYKADDYIRDYGDYISMVKP